MGTDEIEVVEYLKSCPSTYVSVTEIMRRVGGKKRMQQDPDWVRPVVRRMLSDEVVESDEFGQIRLKLREGVKPEPSKLTMDNFETWELVLGEQQEQEQESTGPTTPC